MRRYLILLLAGILAVPTFSHSSALAINRSWDSGGSNDNWSNTSNWSPNGDPGGDDLFIGNLPAGQNQFTLVDFDYSIDTLSMSGGSSADTDGNQLDVNGLTSLATGSNALLRLRERTTGSPLFPQSLVTNTLTVGESSTVEMYDDSVLEVDSGLFTLRGTLVGNGELQLTDVVPSATSLFNNSGTLSVGIAPFGINPPARTLTINRSTPNARIDLDGDGTGVVSLQQNATLDNNVQIIEPFSGNLNMGPNSTVDMADAWQVDGNININSSEFFLTAPATITGGLLGLDSSGVITLDEADEELHFDAPLLSGGTVANSGTITFNEDAQFSSSGDFQMNGASASMVVNSNVTISQDGFNLDGNGTATNVIDINQGGRLDLVGAPELRVDNVININGGELVLRDYFLEFNNLVVLNSTPTSSAKILSEFGPGNSPHNLGDGVGTGDARLNVVGNGVSEIEVPASNEVFVFESDALVDVALGSTLEINGLLTIMPGAQVTGEGVFRTGRLGILEGDTTIDVATIDFDYGLNTNISFPDHFIGGHLTINADAIEETDSGFDGDMEVRFDDNVLSPYNGRLTMNVPGGWRFNSGTITLDLISGSAPSMLSGDRVTIGSAATLVADGQGIIVDAPFTLEGNLSIPDPNHILNSTGPLGGPRLENRIEGGSITGLGSLGLIDSNLAGFGSINPEINAANSSRITADDGTLNINGNIENVGELVVTDDGVLNVALPWTTSDTDTGLELQGGEVSGASINNIGNGIRGHGLVTAQIFNLGTIRAEGGGTLIFDPTTGSNTYNQSSSQGDFIADTADLILRNPGGTQSTFGEVQVGSGQEISIEGFRLNYEPGARLFITEGTYRTQDRFSFDGILDIAGTTPSRIVVESSFTTVFLSDTDADLDADLELDVPIAAIVPGASFSGAGALIILDGSRLHLQDGANVGVAVENQGSISPGASNFDNAGMVTVDAFEQTTTGILQADISGVAPGTFDLLTVDNNALLDGTLEVNLFDGFEPILGNSFTILETTFGNVGGTFDNLDFPIFNGLTFGVVYNPQSVVLQVVQSADVDMDGDVDGIDFLIIQSTNPSLIPLWESQYGYSSSHVAAVSSVPEPSTIVLALLMTVASGLRRVRTTS